MNAPDTILQHYRQMASDTLVGRDWLLLRQQQAAGQLQQLLLPERREEGWRYTPLPPILEYDFKPAEPEEELLFADDVAQLRLTEADSPCIVLLNGFFMEELSSLPEDGLLEIHNLSTALHGGSSEVFARLGELSGEKPHLFSALSMAMIGEGAYLRIPAGTVVTKPIEILHVSISFESEFIAQPRLLVVLEEGAQATLIEHYEHLSDTLCLNNMVAEIFLESGAQLLHPRLQSESLRTRHLSSLHIRQAAGSRYQGTTLALGGAWSRTEFHVSFSGSGADCTLNGFYLAGDKQSHDMHLDVIHAVPGCTSRERFKGILYGHSRAVFDGNVVVNADAQKTDARLTNDNLLLSRDAEIDTKPRLEIHADDVQCSHGTTVGQIDPEMLFYLRARGIPQEQAVQMICAGFAGEILETCQWEPLQQRAEAFITRQLGDVARKLEG